MNKRQWPLVCKYCAREFWGWHATQRYCDQKCFGLDKRLTEADFWALVNTSTHPQGCWVWTGSSFGNGDGMIYGSFASNYAHRYAYACYHPDEEELGPTDFICHTCDNGLCVRKDHLFKGTAYDNTHDALAKGRLSKGSKHPGATTTEEVVREIWADWKAGILSQAAIARKHGVTYSVVMHIRQGKSWKHITQKAS
jgi:hypothetical protein